jgi:hypothetical protein
MFSGLRKKLVVGASTALLFSTVAAGAVAATPAKSDQSGEAHGHFIGRFSIETFAVAPDVTSAPVVFDDQPFPDASQNPAFNPIQMYHLGLWFNSPADAQKAGCANTVTPFNGEHNAGIQVLNTAQFKDDQGPLRQIHN